MLPIKEDTVSPDALDFGGVTTVPGVTVVVPEAGTVAVVFAAPPEKLSRLGCPFGNGFAFGFAIKVSSLGCPVGKNPAYKDATLGCPLGNGVPAA